MVWLRRGVVQVLSLVLLISLVGGALTISVNRDLSQPDKIKRWLSESKLHEHFVTNTIEEAKKSAGDNDRSGAVSLSDAAVQQAAQDAFSPQLVEQSVNTFLDSNYSWLEGKTGTPNFTIDLTAAKQDFAQRVGEYVRIYSSSLPVCTVAQLIQLQSQPIDPLSATCRPSPLTPESLGAQTAQQLRASSEFLSNPVITAGNINPETGNGQGQPYYQKLSHLPKAYQLATKLPWILGSLAALSALGIIYIAPRKRRGLRRVGILLTVAGTMLIAFKFVADFGFQKLEQRVFNNASIGQLQQSLTDFAHRAEASLVKTEMVIGIAFAILAFIIFAVLFKTRRARPGPDDSHSTPKKPVPESADPPLDLKPSHRPPRLVQ